MSMWQVTCGNVTKQKEEDQYQINAHSKKCSYQDVSYIDELNMSNHSMRDIYERKSMQREHWCNLQAQSGNYIFINN